MKLLLLVAALPVSVSTSAVPGFYSLRVDGPDTRDSSVGVDVGTSNVTGTVVRVR